ncbi:MAG: hypothetical protein WCQ67_03940 [Treponema sp.]
MKKQIILATALLASASLFAEESFKVSGFVRAGLSSTFGEDSKLSTKTWFPGVYFNGDSSSTRGRLNFAFNGSNETASYGAFLRLQYSGEATGWNIGSVSYANAFVNLFNNKLTVAAGKFSDNWIGSVGYEGYSVLDGNSGVVVAVKPIAGLTVAGAAVIDNCKNEAGSYDLSSKAFFGGVSYSSDLISAAVSYAGWGTMAAGVSFGGVKNLGLSAECQIETTEDVSSQRLVADECVEFTGVEGWTFALLSFQTLDSASVAASDDFTFSVTPAVSYTLNDLISFSLEGTWSQGVYDGASNGYATIVPAVTLSADKTASAKVWGLISTDSEQTKSAAGVGVIKKF